MAGACVLCDVDVMRLSCLVLVLVAGVSDQGARLTS
jgi:hypothetical protein